MPLKLPVNERFLHLVANIIGAAGVLALAGGGFLYVQYNNLSSLCESVPPRAASDSRWDLPTRCSHWAFRADLGVGLMVLGLAGIALGFFGGWLYWRRFSPDLRP
jgi:hypothetical protein